MPAIRSVTALVFVLAVQQASIGDEAPPIAALSLTGKADPRMAPIDELLTSFVRDHQLPGAAVAVARKGRLVYSRGFGAADAGTKAAVEPTSLFRIASISKPITAVAVLQLVEQGKLGLEERVFDLLGEGQRAAAPTVADARLRQITVRQLLQHTGGWDRDVSFDPMFRAVEIASELKVAVPARQADIIRYMLGRSLDFNPGERYAYSNFGYCLLGRLIEKQTGAPYDAYVKQHVLAPLGITRMRLGATLPEGRADGEVSYHEPAGKVGPAVVGNEIGKNVPLPYGTWCLEAMDSHGGWIASAVDLVRFASAFDDPERCPVLKAETVAAMFARPEGLAGHDAEGKPKPTYYGLGWQVRPEGRGGGPVHWHTGSLDGTSTILVHRHDGLSWAILFNTRNAPTPDKAPARLIDLDMHKAVESVTDWPEGEGLVGP